jgi:hypothetical protein
MTSSEVENAVASIRAWHDADPSRAPEEASVARLGEVARLEESDGYWGLAAESYHGARSGRPASPPQ